MCFTRRGSYTPVVLSASLAIIVLALLDAAKEREPSSQFEFAKGRGRLRAYRYEHSRQVERVRHSCGGESAKEGDKGSATRRCTQKGEERELASSLSRNYKQRSSRESAKT